MTTSSSLTQQENTKRSKKFSMQLKRCAGRCPNASLPAVRETRRCWLPTHRKHRRFCSGRRRGPWINASPPLGAGCNVYRRGGPKGQLSTKSRKQSVSVQSSGKYRSNPDISNHLRFDDLRYLSSMTVLLLGATVCWRFSLDSLGTLVHSWHGPSLRKRILCRPWAALKSNLRVLIEVSF